MEKKTGIIRSEDILKVREEINKRAKNNYGRTKEKDRL